MIEKKRIFLLNDEQKILVFLNFGTEEYITHIIIPSVDMQVLDMIPLEDMEYIFETNKRTDKLEVINNHIRKVHYNIQNIYYAIQCEVTEEMRSNIMNFCTLQNFVPEFMSIQEMEDALRYIKENYEDVRNPKKLIESLYVLKRKLNYEEY